MTKRKQVRKSKQKARKSLTPDQLLERRARRQRARNIRDIKKSGLADALGFRQVLEHKRQVDATRRALVAGVIPVVRTRMDTYKAVLAKPTGNVLEDLEATARAALSLAAAFLKLTEAALDVLPLARDAGGNYIDSQAELDSSKDSRVIDRLCGQLREAE